MRTLLLHPRGFARGFVALLVALTLIGFALPGRAETPCAGSFCWIERGFAGQEFTALVSPPGYPCIVAWTALSGGGLELSTDCGVQYSKLFGPSAYDVTARDENVGYVAAGELGIAKTRDGGGTWVAINAGLPPTLDARAILLHTAHPESTFCALYGAGVFLGGPTGATIDSFLWAPINEGLGDLGVRALGRARGGSFMIAATDGGIWRRGNNVWSLVAPGLLANAIVIDSADSSRVYAATENGVYRSLNQGMSWIPSSSGMPGGTAVNDIARRSEGPNVLYAGTRGQGVWESVDYGASWRAFGPALPGDNDARAVLCAVGGMAADSAAVFVGTRNNGLFQAGYSTPAIPSTWGQLKDRYRH